MTVSRLMGGTMTSDVADVWSVRVDDLLAWHDPFGAWDCGPVTRQEVTLAIGDGRLEPSPFQGSHARIADRAYHVERIAWLTVHADDRPLELDVGIPSLGYHAHTPPFDFTDGNHRLCAAAIRGDERIAVVYGGEEDAFFDVFADRLKAGCIDQDGDYLRIAPNQAGE